MYKLLVLLAVVAAVGAWYTTPGTPPPWKRGNKDGSFIKQLANLLGKRQHDSSTPEPASTHGPFKRLVDLLDKRQHDSSTPEPASTPGPFKRLVDLLGKRQYDSSTPEPASTPGPFKRLVDLLRKRQYDSSTPEPASTPGPFKRLVDLLEKRSRSGSKSGKRDIVSFDYIPSTTTSSPVKRLINLLEEKRSEEKRAMSLFIYNGKTLTVSYMVCVEEDKAKTPCKNRKGVISHALAIIDDNNNKVVFDTTEDYMEDTGGPTRKYDMNMLVKDEPYTIWACELYPEGKGGDPTPYECSRGEIIGGVPKFNFGGRVYNPIKSEGRNGNAI